jgi:RNA polymerase sigma-70 factor (ECF subfamily)
VLRSGEQAVISAAARGAWQDLDSKLRPFIARRVHGAADVDDIVQDVFLRIQRGLGALRDEDRFGPWVYRVARSAIVDHQRRSAKHVVAGPDDAEDVAIEEADDDGAVERELASYVAAFVAMLPSPYREALTLTELEGLTQKAAAEMLGISLSAMKSRVQRGRQQLRGALEDCCRIALDARGRVLSCEPRPDGKVPESCCAGPDSARGVELPRDEAVARKGC